MTKIEIEVPDALVGEDPHEAGAALSAALRLYVSASHGWEREAEIGRSIDLRAGQHPEADIVISTPDMGRVTANLKGGDATLNLDASMASLRTSALTRLLASVANTPGGLGAALSLLESVAERGEVLRHVTDAVANQPVAIGPAAAGQIALVDQAWRGIEQRYGVLDAGGYAELTGSSAKNRSAASKAKVKGLVGYRRGRRLLYPRFQFEGRGIRPGWNEIVAPLRGAGWDDEDIVLWLAAPNGALDRHSPVEALDDGDRSQVLDLVRDQVAGVW